MSRRYRSLLFHLSLMLCIVFVSVGCGTTLVKVPVPPPINKDFAITLTWNYDFTNFLVCSATVTKGCLTGFTVGYLSGGATVILPGGANLPTSVCTGSTQPLTCKYSGNSQLPIGQITWVATTNGLDGTGAVVTATSNSAVPTPISLLSPTNVAGSAQ